MIISIITPSYNQGKFIAKTIESVLSQEGEFYIDYIIVDGKSNDNSEDVIKGYEELLNKNCETREIDSLKFYLPNHNFPLNRCLGISYRYLSEKDGGQSEAINKGFLMAKGSILAWLNSDDYYLENALELVVNAMKSNSEFEVVYGKSVAIDENNEELWSYGLIDLNLHMLLHKRVMTPQPSVFFSKSIFEKCGFLRNELHYCMDYEFLVRLLVAGIKFLPLNHKLSVQCYHSSSKSCSAQEKFVIEEQKIINEYVRKLNLVNWLNICKCWIQRKLKKWGLMKGFSLS